MNEYLNRRYAGNMLVARKQKSKFDSHCWKYFQIKFSIDYTKLNRSRIHVSKIEKEIQSSSTS